MTQDGKNATALPLGEPSATRFAALTEQQHEAFIQAMRAYIAMDHSGDLPVRDDAAFFLHNQLDYQVDDLQYIYELVDGGDEEELDSIESAVKRFQEGIENFKETESEDPTKGATPATGVSFATAAKAQAYNPLGLLEFDPAEGISWAAIMDAQPVEDQLRKAVMESLHRGKKPGALGLPLPFDFEKAFPFAWKLIDPVAKLLGQDIYMDPATSCGKVTSKVFSDDKEAREEEIQACLNNTKRIEELNNLAFVGAMLSSLEVLPTWTDLKNTASSTHAGHHYVGIVAAMCATEYQDGINMQRQLAWYPAYKGLANKAETAATAVCGNAAAAKQLVGVIKQLLRKRVQGVKKATVYCALRAMDSPTASQLEAISTFEKNYPDRNVNEKSLLEADKQLKVYQERLSASGAQYFVSTLPFRNEKRKVTQPKDGYGKNHKGKVETETVIKTIRVRNRPRLITKNVTVQEEAVAKNFNMALTRMSDTNMPKMAFSRFSSITEWAKNIERKAAELQSVTKRWTIVMNHRKSLIRAAHQAALAKLPPGAPRGGQAEWEAAIKTAVPDPAEVEKTSWESISDYFDPEVTGYAMAALQSPDAIAESIARWLGRQRAENSQ